MGQGGVLRGGNVGTTRCFDAGETIVNRGDAADEMFVIRSGEVEIRRERALGDGLVARLGPGYFGELGPMLNLPRSAAARAKTAVELTGYTARRFRQRFPTAPRT